MKIITITLNPAVDIFLNVDYLKCGKETRAFSEAISAGGKGINISKALSYSGVENKALILVSYNDYDFFKNELDLYGIDSEFFTVEGNVRKNITVRESNQTETRICSDKFECSEKKLDDLLDRITEICSEDDTVVICSGKFPSNISRKKRLSFAMKLSEMSRYFILDSKSFDSDEIIEISPWMIKPNAEEAESLFGIKTDDVTGLVCSARRIVDKGLKNIVITLGEKGAVYCGEYGEYYAIGRKIKSVSSVGAGDCFIAGATYSLIKNNGADIGDIMRYGLSFGTAKCLHESTKPPSMKEITEIMNSVKIKKLKMP